MSPKIIIALVIIILIPISGICFLRYTSGCCDEVLSLIDLARNEDGDTSIKRAMEIWSKNEAFLTALTTHEEVDSVRNALSRALTLRKLSDKEECSQALSEAYTSTVIVKNFDYPTLRNIF